MRKKRQSTIGDLFEAWLGPEKQRKAKKKPRKLHIRIIPAKVDDEIALTELTHVLKRIAEANGIRPGPKSRRPKGKRR